MNVCLHTLQWFKNGVFRTDDRRPQPTAARPRYTHSEDKPRLPPVRICPLPLIPIPAAEKTRSLFSQLVLGHYVCPEPVLVN
jgi:hypothetical protein